MKECLCPYSETIDAERIEYRGIIGPVIGAGEIEMPCEDNNNDDYILIGGSCMHEPVDTGFNLRASFYEKIRLSFEQLQDTWICAYGRGSMAPTLKMTLTCLESNPPEQPMFDPVCNCPTPVDIRKRFYSPRTGRFLYPLASRDDVAYCPEDAVMIMGSCTAIANDYIPPRDNPPPENALLSRAGFSFNPDNPHEWVCGGYNPSVSETFILRTSIICVSPPEEDEAPEIEPLADRVVRSEVSGEIPPDDNFSLTVGCEAGDTLLHGGCTILSDEPESFFAFLYEHGFSSDNRTAWRCSWNNPTDLIFDARATAICLKPLSEENQSQSAQLYYLQSESVVSPAP